MTGDYPTLVATLLGVGIAALGMIAAILGVITYGVVTYGPSLVKKRFDTWNAQMDQARVLTETIVADKSVAAAEEIGRERGLRGTEKLVLAQQIANGANTSTPVSGDALKASVAKMRASIPTAGIASIAPGTLLSVPVQVVSSTPPESGVEVERPTIPRPAPMPTGTAPSTPRRTP